MSAISLPRLHRHPARFRPLLWVLAGWLLATVAAAARRDHYFQTISSAEGLAQNTVHAMLQDADGYVWVATQGGLHRYDGSEFVRFQHDPGRPDSLPESFITALAADSAQGLWIGMNARYLARLDLGRGHIERHDAGVDAEEDRRRNQVSAIAVGADGMLWLGTAAGIERYHPQRGERTSVLRLAGEGRVDRRGMPRSIDLQFDRQGLLWAATDGGLFRIDPSSLSYQRIGPERPAFGLHRDRAGQLWVGSIDGLFRVDQVGALQPVRRPDGEPFGAVWRLASDSRNRLWLVFLAGHVARYDPLDGSLRLIEYQAGMPAGLPERRVASIMVDHSDLVWIGGEATGLATTPAAGARFPMLFDSRAEGDPRASNNLRAILETGEGELWVGAESDGLKRVDGGRGEFENFIDLLERAATGSASGRGIRVLGLEQLEDGSIVAGTDHGAFVIDPARRRAHLLDPRGLAAVGFDGRFRSVLRDRDGTLWFATDTQGLLRYQPDQQRWRRYPVEAAVASDRQPLVNHVYQAPDGLIYASHMKGLSRLQPDSGALQTFRHDPHDPQSLSGELVRGVLQAIDGRLWVATHSGISISLGPAKEQPLRFRRLTVDDGLPSNTVYGVLEDRQGRIWASSNLGLMRIEPASGRVRHFTLRDGLQDLEFNGGAQRLLSDGRLAFGGIRGLNLFDPAAISESEFQPPVVLAALRVGGSRDNLAPLATPTQVDVKQTDRVYRFRFAALDYTAPGQNRFEYLLEGFDAGWTEASSGADITYTNLDSGRYRLRVRASNHDGRWSERELALALHVIPPWWSSGVAQLLYLLLGALAVAALGGLQRRRRRQELRLLQQIQEREERLKLALWGSGDEFWDWDIRANQLVRVGADQLLGSRAQQVLSTDDWRGNAVHPDDLPRVQQILQAHISGRIPAFESEHRIRNDQGEWIWVRSRGKLVARDHNGQPLRMAGTARDITRSRQAEGERRIALEVLRSMGEAVAVTDLEFHFVSVNPAFQRITGYSADEVDGAPASLLDSPQQPPEFYRRLRESAERTGQWTGELWQRRKDGEEFLAALELSEVRDAQGLRSHFVAVVSDITERKRAEQELRYLANYDTLTGLPNRALLSERLARALARARRAGSRVAVMFLDLDRFKDINDSLGHSVGDRILKSAAARLLATVAESDTVARLGGDEFTVVLEDIRELAEVERMAAAIVAAFAAPLDLDGRSEVQISPSVGVALYPDHGQMPTDLLKSADTAMYAAKARGRNTWQLYDEAMDAETRRRTAMLAALRRALDRGEFQLVFQPQLALGENRVTGVEALLRWHCAELGSVSPVEFIPLAEETGLILPIGEWVLLEAARTLARWRSVGFDRLVMAVNVSVLQFLRSHLDEQVRAVLEETGLPASALELEVTESMVMANAEQAIRMLRSLREIGVSLAIDDFGTGYSSLAYLKRLPIDTLKIDKEFVGDLTADPDDAAITTTVIQMAHSLGLRVIAEGVESADQLSFLHHHHCDEIQGYYLAKPMAEAECLAFLRQGLGAPAVIP